jgi:Lanthionine synthetase C-like protein
VTALYAAEMPLFDPGEHEPLTESRWDERRVRVAIERIVAQTVDAYEPGKFWPRSPLDDYGLPVERDRSLWIGAAGVLWALDRLGAGIGECGVYDAYRSRPDVPDSPGLMMGETGVLLVSWRLRPTREKEERLHELVSGNARNPEHELFNGAPGTMLAALYLYEACGDAQWRELWRECADAVWEQFRPDPELDCRIWIQYRRGRLIRSIGAGHGFASNVRSLLRGEALLREEQAAELRRAAAETASALALRENGLANWPTSADPYWAEQFSTRVQWCHGAPGLVTSLSTLARDDETDDLLCSAGELVWFAGPLRKGSGLCHGTAGNGSAFLALHARTGKERWLIRARAFAIHALEQVERSQPRYSLWTGDIGVALYLYACLDGKYGMPVLDVL